MAQCRFVMAQCWFVMVLPVVAMAVREIGMVWRWCLAVARAGIPATGLNVPAGAPSLLFGVEIRGRGFLLGCRAARDFLSICGGLSLSGIPRTFRVVD
jgi:hypothetical protein